jgi:hypothetical protein
MMIPVKVNKISFHPPSRSYAVVLKEINGPRKLPVIVGAFEAQAIAISLEFMETPRPLTHDLIGNIIREIGSKLTAVKITELREGVFYARMELQGKTIGKRSIDSRPSDALAVALRLSAPILVADKVLEEAAIVEGEEEDIKVGVEKSQVTSRQLLEKRLQKAIEEEEYEIAARIRDRLKELKS